MRSFGSQPTKTLPPLWTNVLGARVRSGASAAPRDSYSSSMRSSHQGSHVAPASRKPKLTSGKRSKTPSNIMLVNCRMMPYGWATECAWMNVGKISAPGANGEPEACTATGRRASRAAS